MEKIIYPDYDHSILSTTSSILKYYGLDNGYKSLFVLDEKLKTKYKNICLIILDGMGKSILDKNDKEGFFSKNIADVVTSCYPSTTTACLTSYYSSKSPNETGYIAWSQYFKEYGRSIDMLKQVDSYSGKELNVINDVFENKLNYKSTFSMLEEAGVMAYEVVPKYSKRHSKRCVIADNIDEMASSIKDLCSMESDKFIMAYCDNPDSFLHKYGVESGEVKDFIFKSEKVIKNLVEDVEDTLFIISCDHGHKDIGNVYNMNDYQDLKDLLIMPESFESRCVTFFVKEGCRDKFKKLFEEHFKDFKLFTKKEFLDLDMLGYGIRHKKIDDFVGDFVACSTGSSIIRLQNDYFEGKKVKKSTHCGLTSDEMLVPVIIL